MMTTMDQDLSRGQDLEEEVLRLREEVRVARRSLERWSATASGLVNAFALSAKEAARLGEMACQQIEEAAADVSFVKRLRWVHPSFPSAPANAPDLKLDDCEENIWQIHWRPAWTIDLSADVEIKGLSVATTQLRIRLHNVTLSGRLRLGPSHDWSQVVASFLPDPHLDLDVSCALSIGHFIIPDIALIQQRVKSEAIDWLHRMMVEPNSYCFELLDHDDDIHSLTDDDIKIAERAAQYASVRALDDSFFLGGGQPFLSSFFSLGSGLYHSASPSSF